jgi:hypothetical protein
MQGLEATASLIVYIHISSQDGRGGEIRTHDLLVPNQALYQAKLRPETRGAIVQAF